MSIELTEEQRQAVLNGVPVRLPAPDLGKDIVLLRADVYEDIRELLEEERQREALARVALRNAVGRMDDEP